jgi:hypothetical protein
MSGFSTLFYTISSAFVQGPGTSYEAARQASGRAGCPRSRAEKSARTKSSRTKSTSGLASERSPCRRRQIYGGEAKQKWSIVCLPRKTRSNAAVGVVFRAQVQALSAFAIPTSARSKSMTYTGAFMRLVFWLHDHTKFPRALGSPRSRQ